MLIISAAQARAWDQYTIANEPILSIDLMERAARACVDWIEQNLSGHKKKFSIFCGKGNNGGDGLAIARMLCPHHDVEVFILEFGHLGTEDFQVNLSRLHALPNVEIRFIQEGKPLPDLVAGDYIIDALFGTGLNRALVGITAELVAHINASGCPVIAIDMPSGLSSDQSSRDTPVIHAHHTLSFQAYKKAFLMPENAQAVGQVHILDIGLHPVYEQETQSPDHWIDLPLARSIYRPRPPFSHKGHFGHALLLAGSHGKMGAAILAARAAIAGGTGLLTCHIPSCGYEILQTAVPESMVSVCEGEEILNIPGNMDRYKTVGVGPGIGTGPGTPLMLEALLRDYQKPMVIDADAINILAGEPSLQSRVPKNSILTPHPKEFDRLAGDSGNDFERLEKVAQLAEKLDCVIVLKGHHSLVCMPGGQRYWNRTGNPGMAKGGSGDVLTGLITGLLASGYSPEQAALLGVYLHGMAGDLAAEVHSPESMTASEIIHELGRGFQIISKSAN